MTSLLVALAGPQGAPHQPVHGASTTAHAATQLPELANGPS